LLLRPPETWGVHEVATWAYLPPEHGGAGRCSTLLNKRMLDLQILGMLDFGLAEISCLPKWATIWTPQLCDMLGFSKPGKTSSRGQPPETLLSMPVKECIA